VLGEWSRVEHRAEGTGRNDEETRTPCPADNASVGIPPP
jgi:hypothetical protein